MTATNRPPAFIVAICYVCLVSATPAPHSGGISNQARRPLRIAPRVATGSAILSYSTYLGGTSDDAANAVTTDSSGNIYVAGYTASTDFPTTTGAYKITQQGGVYDAFEIGRASCRERV